VLEHRLASVNTAWVSFDETGLTDKGPQRGLSYPCLHHVGRSKKERKNEFGRMQKIKNKIKTLLNLAKPKLKSRFRYVGEASHWINVNILNSFAKN
jgi:hypothetical protein